MNVNNRRLTPQGIPVDVNSQPESSSSGATAGRDVTMSPEALGADVHISTSPDNTQSLNIGLSAYAISTHDDVMPVVRDQATGCVEISRRSSPEYHELMSQINEQLIRDPCNDSMKAIDRLFTKIYQCDFSTDEIKELNDLKTKIATHYFQLLEKQKSELINELKRCFTLESTGGANVLFKRFINDVKNLYASFSTITHQTLSNVGLTILGSQYDHNQISQLTEQLCQQDRFEFSLQDLSQAQLAELEECEHAAKQIIRRKGKNKPIVLENYLNRLTTILAKSLQLTESSCHRHLEAVNLIAAELTSSFEMSAGSDPDKVWHDMFFEAILDTRFPTDFMSSYRDFLSPLPPEEWGLAQLEGFITMLKCSGHKLDYCTADFHWLLTKMDGQDASSTASNERAVTRQSTKATTSRRAADNLEHGEDRCVEHGEQPQEDNFTDKDRNRELAIFLEVVALEKSGEFHHSKFDKHYSNWHVLVEILLGERALTSPDARRAIKLLSNLSQRGVKTANLHFVDATGDASEAMAQLDRTIKIISEKKPEKITIEQNRQSRKASVSLWRAGQIFHTFEVPAITESGIPYESLAMSVQLLTGKTLVRQLFWQEGGGKLGGGQTHQLEAPKKRR